MRWTLWIRWTSGRRSFKWRRIMYTNYDWIQWSDRHARRRRAISVSLSSPSAVGTEYSRCRRCQFTFSRSNMWITGLVRKYSDKNYIMHEPWRWTKLFLLVLFALIALRRCSCTRNLFKIHQLRIYKRNGTKFTCRREKTLASTVVYLRNLLLPSCRWRYHVFACNTNLRIRTRRCVSVYSAKTTLHLASYFEMCHFIHLVIDSMKTLVSDRYRCHGLCIFVITSFGRSTVYHYVIGRCHRLKHRLHSCAFLKANRRQKITQSI